MNTISSKNSRWRANAITTVKAVLQTKRGFALRTPPWVRGKLKAVEARLEDVIKSGTGPAVETGLHLLRAGGKRLRPLLAIISGSFYPADGQQIVDIASAVELIHMASLIHDDVIDGADLRRGVPTVNATWRNRVAVLTGDFLFARAFWILGRHKATGVEDVMSEAIRRMCEGEIEQAMRAFNPDLTEEDYISYITKKTASLIAAACRCGALVSQAPTEAVEALTSYGHNLGCAFQIVDDVMDLTASPERIGKPVGLDLMEGTVTLPVLAAMKHNVYGGSIRDMLLSERPVDSEMASEIAALTRKAGGVDHALDVARQHVDRATSALDVLPQCAATNALRWLAGAVLSREA